MQKPARNTLLAALTICALLLRPGSGTAEPVPVRHTEGLSHGFLVLRTLEGKAIAAGEQTQSAHGDRVTNRLVFHFNDGSIHDETAVYSQRQNFRLLHDHLVQKGPSFPRTVDSTIDATSNQVTARYTEEDRKEKNIQERMDLPPDLANGMTLTLLKNLDPNQQRATLSMLAMTPKPRLVKLEITIAGKDSFSFASRTRQATHYVVKVEIGGVAGLVAPLVGKQPPDIHVWIVAGETPAFVKSIGPLYAGGPAWRVEPATLVWPKTPVK